MIDRIDDYCWIGKAITTCFGKQIGGAKIKLLLAILELKDEENRITITIKELALKSNTSFATAFNFMKKLIECGLIKKEKKSHKKPTIYRIVYEENCASKKYLAL